MRLPAIHLSIRARTTLVATVVVGVALAAASAGLIASTRSGLRTSIRDAAKARAVEVAQLAHETTISATVSSAGEAFLVQVIDSAGRVVASSPSIDGQGPLVSVTLAPGESLSRDVASVAELDNEGGDPSETPIGSGWTIAAEGVQTAAGPITVVVVASLGAVDDISGILLPIVYQGGPLLLLVVAGLTWALTGVALRPVDAIRRDAEKVSAADPRRRLRVPATHDEVHDMAETMNLMLDRIEAATVQQRRFTADASHELKSPVAAIRIMVEVAKRDPRYGVAAGLLDEVLAEDMRLELLVSDLLILARYDEAGLPLSVTPTDLGTVATEEASALRARTALQVTTEVADGLRIAVDEERVRQLLRNLLDNASRHARSGIWVQADAEGAEFVVCVSDDGPGIAPEDRERVFERFVRLDSGRARAQGGTGLGLAVCRAIARAHEGEVRIIAPVHGGTTVEVRLPARNEG